MKTNWLSAAAAVRGNRGIGRRALLGGLLVLFLLPTASFAQGTRTPANKKIWQTQYRDLLTRADQLRETIAIETELYADANRRNYRRGRKRHIHRKAMIEAKAELAEVEAKLETIVEDGRRAGALPGWFYDVENEREDAARSPAAPDTSESPVSDGRNPIYAE